MRVVTTTLDMLRAPGGAPQPVPDDVRLDRATAVSPEYARFLYGLIGGPWHWTDRLGWSRQQWIDELAVPGTEFWILYGEGVPTGYLHLQPAEAESGTHVEIRYFGLAEQTLGRGLGRMLLEQGIHAAWTLGERVGLPPITRVWVHTCTLDGPAALANYQARGFTICGTEETDEPVAEKPIGSWIATGGPGAAD